MGFVKKTIKKITGADKAEKRAQEEAERSRREAEERARKQAELEAAQKSAMANAEGGDTEATTEIEGADKVSNKKKQIKGGRKGLTVTRSGGSGLNI